MFRYSRELFQGLLKMFVRTNKRFPNPEESIFMQNQAIRIKNDLLQKKIDLDAINAEEALRIYSRLRPKRPGPKADVLPFKYKKSFADELAEMEKKGELPKSQGIGSLVDDTIEMLKGKDRKSLQAEVKKIIERKGTYADYSPDEIKSILDEADLLLKPNKTKTAEQIITDGDFDPSGMKEGGRIGYAYGRGLKLPNVLRKLGLTMRKAIEEAKERFTNYSGDLKYDADAVLDDILDTYGIDRDTIDQYDLIDAYDKIYKNLSKSKYQTMYDVAAKRALSGQDEIMELQAKNPGLTEELAKKLADKDPTSFTKAVAPKLTERMELKTKYPGITDELLEMIMKDNDPQRKAEVLASLDEALTMMDKGMDKDQIIDVLKKTTRTKNAAGGLNYLMGM